MQKNDNSESKNTRIVCQNSLNMRVIEQHQKLIERINKTLESLFVPIIDTGKKIK